MTTKPTPASQPSPAHNFSNEGYCFNCNMHALGAESECRPNEQPSPARSDKGAERKTVWWDRAAGGFYLSYESIPEKHRAEVGRIVKMIAAMAGEGQECEESSDGEIYAEVSRRAMALAKSEAERATIYQVKSFITPSGWIDCTQVDYEDYAVQGYETRMVFAAQATPAGEAQADATLTNEGTSPAERTPSGESIDTPEFRSLLADYCNARTDGTVAAEKYCLDDLITHIDARRATAGTTAARTFADLTALLPSDFMWGDALQPAILREVLSAYDARCATAGNAAPGELPRFACTYCHSTKQAGKDKCSECGHSEFKTWAEITAGIAASNAAPTCSGCDPAEGFCRACRDAEQRASNAATAAPDRPDNFGQEVTRLVGEIRKPCSLAWRDSLVEELIELIDPTPDGIERAATAAPGDLPPLPKPLKEIDVWVADTVKRNGMKENKTVEPDGDYVTLDQCREYGRACIASNAAPTDRVRRALEAALILCDTEAQRAYFKDEIEALAATAAPGDLVAQLNVLSAEYETKRQAADNPYIERIYLGARDAYSDAARLASNAGAAPLVWLEKCGEVGGYWSEQAERDCKEGGQQYRAVVVVFDSASPTPQAT